MSGDGCDDGYWESCECWKQSYWIDNQNFMRTVHRILERTERNYGVRCELQGLQGLRNAASFAKTIRVAKKEIAKLVRALNRDVRYDAPTDTRTHSALRTIMRSGVECILLHELESFRWKVLAIINRVRDAAEGPPNTRPYTRDFPHICDWWNDDPY